MTIMESLKKQAKLDGCEDIEIVGKNKIKGYTYDEEDDTPMESIYWEQEGMMYVADSFEGLLPVCLGQI